MGKAGRRTGGLDALDVAALWPASAQHIGLPLPHIGRDRDEPRPASEEELE